MNNQWPTAAPLILVIDDDQFLCEDLSQELPNLLSFPVQIETTGDVAEGLEKAFSMKPDLAILDLNYGNQMLDGARATGIDLARKIWQEVNAVSVLLISVSNLSEAYKEMLGRYAPATAKYDVLTVGMIKEFVEPIVRLLPQQLEI